MTTVSVWMALQFSLATMAVRAVEINDDHVYDNSWWEICGFNFVRSRQEP